MTQSPQMRELSQDGVLGGLSVPVRKDTRELALSPGEDAERRGHPPIRKGTLGHKPNLPAS